MRVGFLGDPHVGRAGRWLNDEGVVCRMHRELWARQTEALRRARCTHAIVLGDVFDDPHPSQARQVVALDGLAGLAPIPTICLEGNHDVEDVTTSSLLLLSRIPSTSGLPHVRFVTRRSQVVRWDGLSVAAVPWDAPVPPGRHDLLVFHDAVVGARLNTNFRSPKGLAGVREAGCPAVGGHLHISQRSGSIAFPGTGAQMNFAEPDEKWFWWVDVRRDDYAYGRAPARAPWTLRRVAYDANDPPTCDEPNVLYSLDVGGDRPGPRWQMDHPQVVKMHGGNPKRMIETADRVVSLMEGSSASGEDDRQLLARWLRTHSALSKLMQVRALRVADDLPGGA